MAERKRRVTGRTRRAASPRSRTATRKPRVAKSTKSRVAKSTKSRVAKSTKSRVAKSTKSRVTKSTKSRVTKSKPAAAPAGGSGVPAEWAVKLFDEQIDSLWSQFGSECQEFAEGFNAEMGVSQLHVDSGPEIILAKFAASGAEVYVQLDKAQRVIECIMSSRCAEYGSCLVEQSAVGVMIQGGQLRFVLGSSSMSEEELAVKLLTELIESEVSASSAQ